MFTFDRFDDRGAGLVAIFSVEGVDLSHLLIYGKTDTRLREVVLNQSSLRTRIHNLRSYGINTSVEETVLAEMVRRENAESGDGREVMKT